MPNLFLSLILLTTFLTQVTHPLVWLLHYEEYRIKVKLNQLQVFTSCHCNWTSMILWGLNLTHIHKYIRLKRMNNYPACLLGRDIAEQIDSKQIPNVVRTTMSRRLCWIICIWVEQAVPNYALSDFPLHDYYKWNHFRLYGITYMMKIQHSHEWDYSGILSGFYITVACTVMYMVLHAKEWYN